MSTNYPSSLDDTTVLKNDSTDDTVSSVTHETLHNNVSDAIIAIETVLGTAPNGSYASVKAAVADIVQKTPAADQIIMPSADHVALVAKQGDNTFISNLIEARNHSNSIKFYVDYQGNLNAQAINVAGSAIAASNLSNGVTGTGAVVLAASPTLTGNPVAPTQTSGNNSTRLATTAFVAAAVGAITVPVTSVFGRTGGVTATTNDYTDAQVQNSPTNKLTATGDILYASAANTLARLAIGSAGAALRVTSGIPSWKTLASTGGTLSNYSIPSDDFPSGGSAMLGMGLSITPTSTGVVVVNITSNSTSLTNCRAILQIRYGTGSAPANEAGVVGTTAGGTVTESPSAIGCALTARISGLTVGTAYWIDVSITLTDPAPQGGQFPGLYGGSYTVVEVG